MKPYELYARFLVTKGAESVDELNIDLERLGLPKYTEKEFQKTYQFVHDLVPPTISKKIVKKQWHKDFYQHMKILEVADLWDYERPFFVDGAKVVRLVYDIHSDSQLRTMINALLIKGVKHSDIVNDVTSRFSSMVQTVHLEIYEKFFWNVRRMTRKDWRGYLRLCEGYESEYYFLALTEPLEVLRTALELPSSVSVSNSLQYLFSQAYQRAKRSLNIQTPEGGKEARAWIKTVMELADKYTKHRSGDVEDFGKTLQMEFDYIEEEFPSPGDELLQEVKNKKEPGSDDNDDKSSV